MILYLLRHADAGEPLEGAADDARHLTARGKQRTRNAAAGLRAMGLRFDAILTSPLPRAAETAEIVAAAYANITPPQVLPALAAGLTPANAAAALAPFACHQNLLIVGHEPQLSGLISLLLSGSVDRVHVRLKKGGCVALDLPKRIERGAAKLHWMATQRQLRRQRT